MTHVPLHLFRMYKECEIAKQHYIHIRPKKHIGIAVDTDRPAQCWSKYQLLQQRIDRQLVKELGG